MHRDTAEHGPRFFGRDYGKELMRFVRENYVPVRHFGAEPFHGDAFGSAS